MKNKKWVLLLIIAFPSLFWLILETSTINSKRLPFYGPRQARSAGDTLYHQVSDLFLLPGSNLDSARTEKLNPDTFPLYAVMFIDPSLRTDAYRLTGLWEYLNYKKEKIENIPFVLVTEYDRGNSLAYEELKKLDVNRNVHFYMLRSPEFKSALKDHFEGKPYYIDYSFFLLIDKDRHIRGYYDARYVSELKRLIEEYRHLRLKEEKQKLIETNEIKKSDS